MLAGRRTVSEHWRRSAADMGHRLALAEALAQHLPTHLAQQVIDTGRWPGKVIGGDDTSAGVEATERERIILANLVRERKKNEGLEAQLAAVEGLG